MPIYAYRCSNCGHAQDVLQRMSDPILSVCPACGQPSYVKQVTAAGFQLKGSGWYVTDFRGDKKAGADADKGEKNGEGAAAGAEAKPGEAAAGGEAAAKGGDAAGKPDAAAPAPVAAPTPAPAPAPAPAASGKSAD